MLSPCDTVRKTCLKHTLTEECQKYVSIDKMALKPLAQQMIQRKQGSIATSTSVVQWDEEAWHYVCPEDWSTTVKNERIAAYILALDAVNFCFWPATGYEYQDLATTLTKIAQHDHAQQAELFRKGKKEVSKDFALSAVNLKAMTVDQMKELFQKNHSNGLLPPDVEKRCALWNEVGKVLIEQFDGSAMALIECADHNSAPTLVQQLVDHFPGFCDYCCSSGGGKKQRIAFPKRAQICVGDWNAALKLDLPDVDKLTAFADCHIPQLLHHHNVLICLGPLKVQDAAAAAAAASTAAAQWTTVMTDWHLWQVGECMQNVRELQPHHRVRTIY